jgi:hypothetical protein
MSTTPDGPVQIHADHDTVKHLGNWTTARSFEVRARSAAVEIDLRSPGIADGDIDIAADLDGSVLKLLVPEDAMIDQAQLRWTGRGRVKDLTGRNASGGRTIRLTGHIQRGGEVRVHRGGIAILSAMFSREYLADVRQAHRGGAMPTVDDPTRPGRAGQ